MGAYCSLNGSGFGFYKNPAGFFDKFLGFLNYLSYFPVIVPAWPVFSRAVIYLKRSGLGLLTYDYIRQAVTAAYLAGWIKK